MVKRKSIHFVLSHTKDLDLIAWKNSLRDGEFNRVVNEILIAEQDKKIAKIPCGSKKVENPQTINSRLLITDRYAIELVESFGPKQITSSIKDVIRKHIAKNKQASKPPKDERERIIRNIIYTFEDRMLKSEQKYNGAANKYQKLCDAYDMAIKKIFEEILVCSSAPYVTEACNRLRKLDINRIVNEAFDKAFYEPPVPKKIETVVSAPQIKNQPVEKKEENPKPNPAQNVQKQEIRNKPTPVQNIKKSVEKPVELVSPTSRKEESPQKVIEEDAIKIEQEDRGNDFLRRMMAVAESTQNINKSSKPFKN
ncbi:MAG: hypothetical protein UHM16_06580 [Acutalibacteraceae bacterium]|nr:hypothetical protein [Acutalibacteraceae bacterium]